MNNISAPALDNGLTILEMCASSTAPVGFNDIDLALDVSRATTARLLKILQARGWIEKDAQRGKYCLGQKVKDVFGIQQMAESLHRLSSSVLHELSSQCSNSCICVFWDGKRMLCVNKETHPGSVPMQSVGSAPTDLSRYPWGWFFYESMGPLAKERARKEFQDKIVFDSNYESWMKLYRTNGFTYDDQLFFKPIRRLGAPIRGIDGKIIGALGIGGNPLTIKNNLVKKFGLLLKSHADSLSRLFMERR